MYIQRERERERERKQQSLRNYSLSTEINGTVPIPGILGTKITTQVDYLVKIKYLILVSLALFQLPNTVR